MRQTDRKSVAAETGPAGRRHRWLPAICLLVAGYAFTWWLIDPVSFAHNRERPFLLDWVFFCRFLRHVGGLVEYAGSFMVYSYEIPWLGSLCIFGILLAHGFSMRCILRRFGAKQPALAAWFLTHCLLLTLRHYITIVSVLAIVLALSASCIYSGTPSKAPSLRIVLFAVLSLALGYVAAGAATLFAVVAILYECLARRRYGLAIAILALAGIIPPFLRFLLFEPFQSPFFFRWVPVDKALRQLPHELLVFYLLYPIGIVSAFASSLRRGTRSPACPAPAPSRRAAVIARLPGIAAISFAIVATVILVRRYESTDLLMQADRLMEHRQWTQALAKLENLPVNGDLARHTVIRCLARTGRLLDEMFRYPQIVGPDVILLTNPEMDMLLRIARKRSDVYYELGMVNEAERWIHEAFTDQGEVPFILERLAMINMVRQRPQATAIFLGALARNPWKRAHAMSVMSQIRADPTMSGDTEINRIRSCLSDTDYVGPWKPEEMLQHCLAENAGNRLAYDYLIANCLLDRRINDFAANIVRFRDFYTVMPVHCEEACIAYMHRTGHAPPGLEGWKPGNVTVLRFQSFLDTLRSYGGSLQTAWPALAPAFGSTFWFYDLYGRTSAGPPVTPADFAQQVPAMQGSSR